MYDDGFEAYQQTQVEAKAASADPHRLVLMLVDGFLDELDRIEGHLEARQLERKAQSVARCMDILSGLDTALDMKKGGAIRSEERRVGKECGTRWWRAQ